ncbi:molybdopterin converting factor subunit 1 [Martelella radicis]|uniref:Molybdopterin synthase sulfur carrier subunit n=1 Tax=Martelella radicis TaxID=1397476 RepID=A0A7W6KI15_9HYPH|nr:molybdopterin synthase sulfur carrier subunit [Martelella radicis]
MTKLVYFAWVRERIGVAEEDIILPENVTDIAGLLRFLTERGEGYEAALQEPEIIRVALDRVHAEHDAPLDGAREIALFPPMTGG